MAKLSAADAQASGYTPTSDWNAPRNRCFGAVLATPGGAFLTRQHLFINGGMLISGAKQQQGSNQ